MATITIHDKKKDNSVTVPLEELQRFAGNEYIHPQSVTLYQFTPQGIQVFGAVTIPDYLKGLSIGELEVTSLPLDFTDHITGVRFNSQRQRLTNHLQIEGIDTAFPNLQFWRSMSEIPQWDEIKRSYDQPFIKKLFGEELLEKGLLRYKIKSD
ncbi:MAG: hypothetical protein Q7R56_03380 [Nanoarchaeota archaeon]|nr:hypothetical protein [Nanoarchaeota archaeon]